MRLVPIRKVGGQGTGSGHALRATQTHCIPDLETSCLEATSPKMAGPKGPIQAVLDTDY